MPGKSLSGFGSRFTVVPVQQPREGTWIGLSHARMLYNRPLDSLVKRQMKGVRRWLLNRR